MLKLNWNVFLGLAEQAGFDPTDVEHLTVLYPDVQALYERIEELDAIDVTGIEPLPTYRAGR